MVAISRKIDVKRGRSRVGPRGVDPKARELTVSRRATGGDLVETKRQSATGDVALTTPLLPVFTLSLATLFV